MSETVLEKEMRLRKLKKESFNALAEKRSKKKSSIPNRIGNIIRAGKARYTQYKEDSERLSEQRAAKETERLRIKRQQLKVRANALKQKRRVVQEEIRIQRLESQLRPKFDLFGMNQGFSNASEFERKRKKNKQTKNKFKKKNKRR